MPERHSRAAIFESPGVPLRISAFPLPVLAPDEVIVRIRLATICGSDLHTCSGRRHGAAPSVLGHEMTGEVAELHEAGARDYRGNPLSPGDRVTWSMLWSCGGCYYCKLGLRAKCDGLRKFGHEAVREGWTLSGGYAEHCQLPAGTAIFRVPAHVPDPVAAPSNCATATVAAVLRNVGSLEAKNVIVCGAGMLGLTACAMASAAGANAIIAIEPDARRLEWAKLFGATLALDSAAPADGIRAAVADVTGGRGADIALEFSGAPEACEALPALLRHGGHLAMAGAVYPARPMAIRAEEIVRRMLNISGVYNYQPEDLERGLEFLAGPGSGFPFASLVGATFSLDSINEALTFAAASGSPRVAIQPFSS